ncbi:hypothetical protein DFH08DRAFT_703505, partial [Mycena albidolilacea]
EWDGWSDGDFSALFSMSFVEKHDNLHVHWATQILGGRAGDTDAAVWSRQCQGIIQCESVDCSVVTRPQTRKAGVENQLSKLCICGSRLVHLACKVQSTLHTFSGGVYYQNGGTHNHPRPTCSGPAQSVAKIFPLLVNADHVKYEQQKVLRGSGGHGGDHFRSEFAKMEAFNPNFIRSSQFGLVSVIVMQTPFLASCLIKAVSIDMEAVNGIVPDAAHGFWADRNSILIISSTYEPVYLQCWVPGLISYSNGGTTEHYRIHFFQLFLSMAEESRQRAIELIDDMLANVFDFSAAQRNGFILAYVDFWLHWAPGERDVDELLEAAPKLLKGCRQHFRNQVTQVKKIGGVVDPAQTDVFENYAKLLLKSDTIEDFTVHAEDFISTFPRAESWICWWMLPSHAYMLFPSFRVMSAELWNATPDTTNPEERCTSSFTLLWGKSSIFSTV